jgi:hypothetical protein
MILEFIVSGATRQEIAKHFGISPETVKGHTRTILAKFHAATIRDGIDNMIKYTAAYPLGVTDNEFYFDEIDFQITMLDDLRTTEYKRRHKVYVISGLVTTINSYIDYPGDIFDLTMNGEAPDDITNLGKYRKYSKTLSRTYKAGETFERSLHYKTRAYRSDFSQEASNTIGTPVGKVSMSLQLPRPPKTFQAIVLEKSGFIRVEDRKNATLVSKDNTYQLNVFEPNQGEKFTLGWTW